jgi:DNA-binding CsgD family transcriptional regulator
VTSRNRSPSPPLDGWTFLSQAEWVRIRAQLNLSSRESEIAFLMLADYAESEIATQLRISSHTVHAHVERLYRKLGIHNRRALITCLFRAYTQLGPSPPALTTRR